jgi:hypothetical protein
MARSAPTCRSERGAKRIPLGNGRFALVDPADFERISKYRWYASPHGRGFYAITLDSGLEVAMHRMIMKPRRGYVVHHLDRNGLNNHCRGFEKPASWPENCVSEPVSRMGIVQQGPLDAWKRTRFVKVAVKAERLQDITTPLSWLAAAIQPDPPARGTQEAAR